MNNNSKNSNKKHSQQKNDIKPIFLRVANLKERIQKESSNMYN